jgi:hypothetical protein
MGVCEQCGSIQISAVKPEPFDKFLAVFWNRRLFLCHRCGWKARRDWDDEGVARVRDQRYAAGATVDPAMAVLDGASRASGRRSKKSSRRKAVEPSPLPPASNFALNLSETPDAETPGAAPGTPLYKHRTGGRRRHSRRRDIIAAVAMSALAMFVFTIIGLTGSCDAVSPPQP